MVIFNKGNESVTTPTGEKSEENVMTKTVLETENESVEEFQIEAEEQEKDKVDSPMAVGEMCLVLPICGHL